MASEHSSALIELIKCFAKDRGIEKQILIGLTPDDRTKIVQAVCTRIRIDALSGFVMRVAVAEALLVPLIKLLLSHSGR